MSYGRHEVCKESISTNMKKVMGAEASTTETKQKSSKVMSLGGYSATSRPEVSKSVSNKFVGFDGKKDA